MKASVLMITYNQEAYITQAVTSALDQVVNFDYEIVIGEDCSTDGTRDVLLRLQSENPGLMRLLLPQRNLGMNRNLVQTLQACEGEYVALLEGDDFWTSQHKLQKQVEFLDSHPECSICFHNVVVFDQDGTSEPYLYCPPDQKAMSGLEDLLAGNFIPTCSVMFRRDAVPEIPGWFYDLRMGDWPLSILAAQRGKIGYLGETMAKYRMHGGGVWSKTSLVGRHQSVILMLEKLSLSLDARYASQVRATIESFWQKTAELLLELGVGQGTREGSISEVQKVLSSWPAEPRLRHEWRRRLLSEIYGKLLFESHARRDSGRTRYWMMQLLRSDPSWLRNRGVWSIGLQAALGRQVVDGLARIGAKSTPH